jgi:myo-inositol-1(or 4)-monophosphatase
VRPETLAALEAVRVGLDIARARSGAEAVRSKGGRDIVTAVDVAVERAVRKSLTERFPGLTVVGEEDGGIVEDGAPHWLVDPICGTRNYASGLPLYAVNVALVEDGRVTACAVGDGGSGVRFLAERGAGAHRMAETGPARLRASDASKTIDLPGYAPRVERGPGADVVRAAILADRYDVRILATTASLAYVADGRIAATAFLDLPDAIHTAAGCLLAEEAGALVTETDGRPWTLASRSLVAAASREVHEHLLSLIAAASRV